MTLPKRKLQRLKGYSYSANGVYFITLCIKDRKCILSKITVGTGVLDCPKNILTKYGKIAERNLVNMSEFYETIKVEKYVIMPNHIHMIVRIFAKEGEGGQSGTPVPTNSLLSQFVGTFKRFCNREYGANLWQRSFHDHIIRGEEDYKEIWEYIDTNAVRWEKDCFFTR